MARVGYGFITISDINDGVAGARNAVRYLYHTSQTDDVPESPSATITWSTGALSSITTGWSETPPVVDATGTDRPWVSTVTFHQASSSSQTATTTATGSSPKKGFTFDGVVTFTNNDLSDGTNTYDPANVVNSGTTTIDGGKITTQTITSLGAVTAGTFSLGNGAFAVDSSGVLSATGANISGDITADTLNVTNATVTGDLIATGLVDFPNVEATNMTQSMRNAIEEIIVSKFGSDASTGYYADATGTFDINDDDTEVCKITGFVHTSSSVDIDVTFSRSWLASSSGVPSVVVKIQRKLSSDTTWTTIKTQTVTGTSVYEPETGDYFAGITGVVSANDNPDAGTYDYRFLTGTVLNLFTITINASLEANEQGEQIGTIDLANYAALAQDETITGNWTFNGTTSGINYDDLSNKPTIPSLTGYATESYVTTALSNLVNSAPTTLDTLNELASALGDDPNFAQTTATTLGTKWTQDNTKISNWDTAYSWGNHASAGYLTSIPEPVNGNWWNDGFVQVATDGVMEMGKYMDFHTTNSGGNADYDLRVTVSPGVFVVGGQVNATGGNSGQWNTAYSWGDHSTQGYATQTYVNNAVSNLVDSAPTTLDTLNELAAALGDDPNFAATVSGSIGTKWTQDNTKISNWDTAYSWGNHASQNYAVTTGDTFTGAITASGGINGLTLANGISGTNFNITGVNELKINDSGEGINFHDNVSLFAIDDATDNKMNFSGASELQVNGRRVFEANYHPNADKWTTARTHTVTLTGDVTGTASQSVDGTGNRTWTINSTVGNDSHTHDDRYQKRFSGTATINNTAFNTVATVNGDGLASGVDLHISGTSGGVVVNVNAQILVNHSTDIMIKTDSGIYTQLEIKVVSTNNEDFAIELLRVGGSGNTSVQIEISPLSSETITFTNSHSYTGATKIVTTKPGLVSVGTGGSNYNFRTDGEYYAANTSRVFHDTYHPNADKWTTAKTLSLTGDVTGSVSWDGSANASITTVVANDSHTHDGRYYTEAESDTRFVNVTGDTMTGVLTLQQGQDDGISISGNKIRAVGDGMTITSDGIRFGAKDAQWDYDEWAGLKYYHPSKTIYFGGARASTSYWENNAGTLNDTTIDFVGVTNLKHNGTTFLDSNRTFIGNDGYFSGDVHVNSGSSGSDYLRLHKTASGDGGILFLTDNTLNWQNVQSSTGLNWYSYSDGSTVASIKNDGTFTAKRGYQINGTTVIDSSRNITGASITGSSLTVSGSGQYVAGSIYSDSNWGMLFRAKQANPNNAQYRWATSTDSELMRIDNNGILKTSGDIHIDSDWGGTYPEQLSVIGNYASMCLRNQSGDFKYLFHTTGSNLELYSGSGWSNNSWTRKIQIDSTGNFDIQAGALKIGTTTVIDSSRNISGVNLNMTGTITTWTNNDNALVLRQGQSGHPWNYIEFRNSANARNWYAGTSTSGNFEIQGETGATGGVNTNKYFNSINGYRIGGTTVIDSSRNLVNIGTASVYRTLTVRSDSQNGYVQSGLYLETLSDYRGAGVFMDNSATNEVWYAGTPYTDHNGYYMIGYQSGGGTDEQAQLTHYKLRVDNAGNVSAKNSLQVNGTTVINSSRDAILNSFTANNTSIIDGSHGSARFQVRYRHGGTQDSIYSSHLTLWASEPGITYDNCGIGGNVNSNGQHYGRQINSNPYGVYLRFDVNSGFSEFWSTTGNAGTAGGKGTRRWYVDASGNTTQTGNVTIDKNTPRLDLKSDQSGSNVGGRLELNENGNLWLNAQGGKDLWLNWLAPNSASSKSDLNVGDGNSGSYILQVSGSSRAVNVSGNMTVVGSLYFNDTATRLYEGSGNSLKVQTSSGYVEVGSQNSGWCHFQTDRASFYFNKKVTVDTGIIESYNEDLILRRASSSSHQMTLNTSGATFTGNVTAYSDITLKDNITEIDNALDKVNSIRGVTYDRIDQDNARHAGVIAQEVEAVLPEVVHTDDDGVKSVAYGNMVGLLIEAIKELKQEIEVLKNGTNSN